MSEQAVVIREQAPVTVAFTDRGVQLRELDQLIRFASWIAKAPGTKWSNAADNIVAIQAGMELGLTPIQALNNIPIVKGRPSIMAAAATAVVRAAKVLQPGTDFRVWYEGEGDKRKAFCQTHRAGQNEPFPPSEFSMADAKRANLVKPDSGWANYPDRMLRARVVGFQCRDYYSDVLLGLVTFEETADVVTVDELPARPPMTEAPPPTPDPLLVEPAPPVPPFFETTPEALWQECLRRTDGDEDAARDLCRDVAGTRFPETLAKHEDRDRILREAAKKLNEHPVFGERREP